MSLKNEIVKSENPLLFSTSSNIKIVYCQILPDVNLFMKYYYHSYVLDYGIVIFSDIVQNRKAFQLNLNINDDIIKSVESFINSKIPLSEFELFMKLTSEF
jgi:hypothetical protein